MKDWWITPATIAAYTAIAFAFGLKAALWWAIGGLMTCVLALWEAGGKRSQPTDIPPNPTHDKGA